MVVVGVVVRVEREWTLRVLKGGGLGWKGEEGRKRELALTLRLVERTF